MKFQGRWPPSIAIVAVEAFELNDSGARFRRIGRLSFYTLSLGAIGVLWYLIQRGAAARVASLFYLVPPATAFEAWLLFDETLLAVQVLGISLTALGVALITRAVTTAAR
ncbi:MAG: hypothetical protein EXR39_18660 [Betaproteobacteria bacterium]|nr:hypothetical protein [Betaproteobacteria bacterium]